MVKSRRYPDVMYEATPEGVKVYKGEKVQEIPKNDFANYGKVKNAELLKVFNNNVNTCPICGKLFASYRSDATYCSSECSDHAQHQKKIGRMEQVKKYCIQCGKELTGRRTRFCCIRCNREYSRTHHQSCYMSNPKTEVKLTRKQREKMLQKDVLAAKKAGLTYGQYKAQETIEMYGRVKI